MEKIALVASPVLEAAQIEINKLPAPQAGDRNIRHFVSPTGDLNVKAVPWIDPVTGEQIAEEPDWVKLFENTTNVAKANFIANLPDPPEGTDNRLIGFGPIRNLKNPITGEIVPKIVPWIEDGVYILEKYVPGIEVSRGRKLHNGFDDPTDPDNLRFFDWFDIRQRAINTIFREIDMRRDKNIGVLGVNLGGTIMMEHHEQGLVPTGQIQFLFEKHLESAGFSNCMCRSFVFPQAKTTEKSEPAYGVDSSQLEIDFIADVAIAMTCAWNDLTEDGRRVFAGFVVAIGTDTCVEAMTLLKTMLGPKCPFSVVAVGAMKPLEEDDSDGLVNFRGAFKDLIELKKRGLSVIGLRVEGGLYEPTKTRKISDKLGHSFQGGEIIDSTKGETAKTADESRFRRTTEDDLKVPYTATQAFRGTDEVHFIKSAMSQDSFRLTREVANSDTKAILVETYASFTQAMKDLRAIIKGSKGRPIFYINQVLGGSIEQDYAVARELNGEGIYPLAMTAETARAKLNLAIRLFGDDNDAIIRYMTGNVEIAHAQDDIGTRIEGATSDM